MALSTPGPMVLMTASARREELADVLIVVQAADGIGEQRSDRADLDSQLGMSTARQAVGHDESAGHPARRAGAGGTNSPCVAATTMSPVAPCERSTWAAASMVLPVLIMSSTMSADRPPTSPTSSSARTAAPLTRVFRTIATRQREERRVPLGQLDRSEVGSDDDGILGQLAREGARDDGYRGEHLDRHAAHRFECSRVRIHDHDRSDRSSGPGVDLAQTFELHASGHTRVIRESRFLYEVNDAIAEVLAGQAPARLVFDMR